MSEIKPSLSNPLEQFVLLAKSAKGAAAVELVKQALDAPGVYMFGELLDMPNIVEVLVSSTQCSKLLSVLSSSICHLYVFFFYMYIILASE